MFLHDYNLPKAFVARKFDLKQLTDALCGPLRGKMKASVAAVTAIGGVGKSCICRELIEQPEIARTFSRIIWFSFYEARAETEDHFLHDVLTRGFQRDIGEQAIAQGPAGLRKALCKALDESSALLILDGMEIVQYTDDPASSNYGEVRPVWNEVDKLLRHILNRSLSSCLITSRVPFNSFETLRGYYHHPLDLFSSHDGGKLLHSLGVSGDVTDLEICSDVLGGHALSLVAAGRYMARRRIGADRITDLAGIPDVFRTSPEGEKVKRISEWYRSELNTAQEYFLTRLSLHGRAVTSANYPVLVQNYSEQSNHDKIYESIIQPLIDRGLVDLLASNDGITRLTAHPLMKLAFSTWLEPAERKRAHEEWARAAASTPHLFFNAMSATDIDSLQPLIDATEQYLAAGNSQEAWLIYSDFGIRLIQLGYYSLARKLTEQLNEARLSDGDWDPDDSILLLDRLASVLLRLELQSDALRIRREQLNLARKSRSYFLKEVENVVSISLAQAGYVSEAAAIKPAGLEARGVIALSKGHYTQAAKWLNDTIEDAYGHSRTVQSQYLAESLYRAGKFEEAARVLEVGLRLAADNHFTCCERSMLYHMTEMSLLSGKLNHAREWFERYNQFLRRLDAPTTRHYWLLLLDDDISGAFSAADEGERLTPSSLLKRHVARARIFAREGRAEMGMVELDAADELAAKSGFKRLRNEVTSLRRELRRRTGA